MGMTMPGDERTGNGAREVLDRYFAEETDLPPESRKLLRADHLLMWLWMEMYKVVPLDEEDTEVSEHDHAG